MDSHRGDTAGNGSAEPQAYYVLRPPAGEWVHLACRTYLADDGVGLARADLFDSDGLIGEVAQPLLVQERKPGNGVA